MALTQGSPLPNIATSQTQKTSAPSWYTDYLSNLAGQTTQAAGQAQFAGAQPLQQQAFQQVGQNVGNYQPTLTAATNMVQGAGSTTAPSVVDQYMNPYVTNVVNQIGELGQRGIRQNLMPGATAGAVGSGQFGSKRGAEVLGNTIRDALQNINAQQAGALASGYQNAITAAQTDLGRQMQSGQQLGNLAGQTQQYGLADVNALSTLGAQQQQIAQNEQLFPLQTLGAAAQNLRGYSIPTEVSSAYLGPIPGAYAASPLQQIAGLGAILAGGSATPFGQAIGSGLANWWSSLGKTGSGGTTDTGGLPMTTQDPFGYTAPADYSWLTGTQGATGNAAQDYQDWLTGSNGWGSYGE